LSTLYYFDPILDYLKHIVYDKPSLYKCLPKSAQAVIENVGLECNLAWKTDKSKLSTSR